MGYIIYMARLSDRIAENVAGEFFVDSSCIDCDTCRRSRPTPSATRRAKPRRPAAGRQRRRKRALMALVACPTSSIGTVHKRDPRRRRGAPSPSRSTTDVYFCGYASPDSYGASSYLIAPPAAATCSSTRRARRARCSRASRRWAACAACSSPTATTWPTTQVFARRFGCARILHRADVAPARARRAHPRR